MSAPTELVGNVSDALEIKRQAIVLDTFDRIQMTSGKGVYFGETANDTNVVMERVKLQGNMEVNEAKFIGNLNVVGNIKVIGQSDFYLENNYVITDKTFVLANSLSSSMSDGAGLYIGGAGGAAIGSLTYKHNLNGFSVSRNMECVGNLSLPNLPNRGKPLRISTNGNVIAGNVGLNEVDNINTVLSNISDLQTRTTLLENTVNPVVLDNRFTAIEANVLQLQIDVENITITSNLDQVSRELGIIRGNIQTINSNIASLEANSVTSNVWAIETRLLTINQYNQLYANTVTANNVITTKSFQTDGAFTANGITCQGNLTVRNPVNPFPDYVKFYPANNSIIFGGANIRVNGQVSNRYLSISDFEEVKCENRFVVANTLVASNIVGNNSTILQFYSNVDARAISSARPKMTISDVVRDVNNSPILGIQGLLNTGKARLRIWNMNSPNFSDTVGFLGPASTLEFPTLGTLIPDNNYTINTANPYCFSLDAWYANLTAGLYALTWIYDATTSINVNGSPYSLTGNGTTHIPVYTRSGSIIIQASGTRGSGGTVFTFKLKFLNPLAF